MNKRYDLVRLICWFGLGVVLLAITACSGVGFAAQNDEVQTSPDGKGYRFEKDGWIYLHIEGEPYERGFQHGYLVAAELGEILRSVEYLTYIETGEHWDFFVEQAENQFTGRLDEEYLDEIKGIAAGAQEAGTDISWGEALAWNGYMELTDYWWPNYLAGAYSAGAGDHLQRIYRHRISYKRWEDRDGAQFVGCVRIRTVLQHDPGHPTR